MNPQPSRINRKLIVVISAAVLVVIGLIALAVSGLPKPAATTASPSPSSSSSSIFATPKPVPTPTPSDAAKAPAPAPSFSGFEALLDDGVTSNQIDDLKYAFTRYAKTSGTQFTSVDVSADTIRIAPRNHNDPNATASTTMTFDVTTNGQTTYHATVVYTNATALDMVLKNSGGAQVFNSGTIDLFNGIGDQS